jgi:uncharacterized membrane protein YdjX (TVP38/TMEM64 family)
LGVFSFNREDSKVGTFWHFKLWFWQVPTGTLKTVKFEELLMNQKTFKNILISCAAIIILVILWPHMADIMAVFSDRDALVALLRKSSVWGWLALIVLLVLQAFLAFIPGQGLMLASGYIYGFWLGCFLTWFGLTLGGQLSFWLARRYGRSFASRFVSQKVLTRWDEIAKRQGMSFYIVTLFIPIFPNDAMCFVAGLGDISFRRFLVANMIGRFVATSAMTFVGAYGTQIPVGVWVAVILVVVLLSLAGKYLKNLFVLPTLEV